MQSARFLLLEFEHNNSSRIKCKSRRSNLKCRILENQGFSYVIKEEDFTVSSLLEAINTVMENRHKYIEAMNKSELNNSIDTIMKLIKKTQL